MSNVGRTATIVASPSSQGSVSPTSIVAPHGSEITNSGATVTIWGNTVTATPAPATAQYTYSFSSWTNGTGYLFDDVTITARFSRTTNRYVILTSVDPSGSGSVTGGGTYDYGATATLTATPAAGHEFSQWSDGNTSNPRSVTVTGPATYTAQFTTLKYTVTWKNHDNTVLETDTQVPYGTVPTYNGPTPTKSPTAQYMYTFSGWSPAVSAITGDTVYVAQYSSTALYTVTWLNWDEYVLEVDQGVPVGSTPTYNSATPTRPATAQYTYVFSGWSPTVAPISGNTTYTAQFTAVVREYVVSVRSNNTAYGTVSSAEVTVPYGTGFSTSGNSLSVGTAAIFTAVPAPATVEQTYSFSSWSTPEGTVVGPTEITAIFVPTINSYTLTLIADGHGSVAGAGVYEYGTEVEISATPELGYGLQKWSDDNTQATRTITITGNTSLTATFVWVARSVKVFVNIYGTWVPIVDNANYDSGGTQ